MRGREKMESMKRLPLVKFFGRTFDHARDYNRLKSNTQRVFALLVDGKWHPAHELRAVGGSEGIRRARSFREQQFGAMVVERERESGGLWRYRLQLHTVDPAIAQAVLEGAIKEKPRKHVKPKDRPANHHQPAQLSLL